MGICIWQLRMAMTNAQRQAKWREANRALFNMRRRNARKKVGGARMTTEREDLSPSRSPAAPFETKKVGEFRMLVLPEEKREEIPVKPQVFRNDYGAQISERAWNLLQKKKQEAKEGGYELDEYSQ